jgi:hemerythrin
MSLLSWDQSFSVGVEEIDLQHQKLIAMMNEFYEQIGSDSQRALRTLLGSLIEYTKFHFTTEEQYFRELGYPESDAHIAKHREFIDKVQDVKSRLDSGKHVVSFEITTFLKDWLTHHVKGNDKAYGRFLNDHGVF